MGDEVHEEEEFWALNPEDVVQVFDLDDEEGLERLQRQLAEHRQNRGVADGESDAEEENDGAAMETEEAAAAPSEDHSKLTFTAHKDTSVICCQVCPTNNALAVTGGQDDVAYVWNTNDGTVKFQCTGHTDTVSCVGFSHNGALVATADLAGMVKVWKVDTGEEVWSFEVSDIEWLQWHQMAPVLLVGTRDGQAWMWKVTGGDVKTFAGFGHSASCGRLLPDGSRMSIGYENGVVKIWDLKSGAVQHTVSNFEGHKSSVLCLDVNPSGSLVITGSDDMTAKVVNTATGKVVSSFQCGNQKEEDDEKEEDSVEAVGFCCVQDYIATGTLNGQLNIWDLPTKTLRHACSHPHGIVKLTWSKTSPVFHTACLDGSIRSYDARNGQIFRTLTGHTAGVLDFSLDSTESMVLTASDDSTAKVFTLQN